MADLASAAERLLPHRHPAHLVTVVREVTESVIRCEGRFPAAHPMVVDGRVPTFLAIEPCAQAAATQVGVNAVERGIEVDELKGVLRGARNLRVHRQWLPAEHPLDLRVEMRGSSRGLYSFEFRLEVDGALAAEGELSFFVMNDLS